MRQHLCRWMEMTNISLLYVMLYVCTSKAVVDNVLLVAQGFSLKYGGDYDEVFAPVVKYSLTLANQFDMEIHQMDLKSVYLNSEIDAEVYMK